MSHGIAPSQSGESLEVDPISPPVPRGPWPAGIGCHGGAASTGSMYWYTGCSIKVCTAQCLSICCQLALPQIAACIGCSACVTDTKLMCHGHAIRGMVKPYYGLCSQAATSIIDVHRTPVSVDSVDRIYYAKVLVCFKHTKFVSFWFCLKSLAQ